MKNYEIIENGQSFITRRARSAEGAIRAARRAITIRGSDYNVRRGELVELEWTARALEGEGEGTDCVTLTLRARAS